MADYREEKVSGSPGLAGAGGRKALGYFQSFFSSPLAERSGWSPLHSYPAGIELYRQNDPVTHIYFIESGIVRLSHIGAGGKEVIISLRRSNWLLGVTSVCVGAEVFSTTARTLTPCSARSISARAFADLLTTDIALSGEINRMLSREIRSITRKIITLGSMTAAERLRHFLGELISEENADDLRKKGRLDLPLKSTELAEIVAVTPQHLCRLLKAPELKTFIRHGGRTLAIVDPLAFMQGIRPEG